MAPTALELCLPYDIQGKYLEINKIASNTINLIEKTKKEYDFFGGPFNLYSILCALNGFSLGSLGYFKEGKVYCEKSLNFAHKINNITSLAASEVVYGLFYTKKGDGKSALPHYKNSIRYCEEGQVNVLLGLAWAGLGHSYLFLGEIEIAKQNIEKGIKIQRDVGAGFSLHHPFRLLAETYFELGDMRNSMSCTEKAIKISKQQNSILNEMQATMLMARILVKLDRSNMDEAEEYILNAIRVFNERKVKAYVCEGYYFLGELFAEIDKKEKASKYLNKAKEMFNEMDMPYWLNKTKKVLLNLNQ
jgi:tetratricopeptide (TPR) repeat protein